MIVKILKIGLKTFYGVAAFPLLKVWRARNKNSENVVIVYPNFPQRILQYFYSDAFVSDLALINAVTNCKEDFRLKIGTKNMKEVASSSVFFNMNQRFNFQGYRNYNRSIVQFVEQVESQNNTVYPNAAEVRWWENKAYMHRRFDELGIRTPDSYLLNLHEDNPEIRFEFPVLLKEIHSCGALGIYKVNNKEEFLSKVADPEIIKRNEFLIVQKLIRIDRDLRVVLVDDKIIYHHWRQNESVENWTPTTYSKGKKGDFGNFPEQWREHIVESFKKTGLASGAFDLAWEDNDYSNPPYIFEISPSYFPNPEPPESISKPYGDYKHGLTLNNPWEKHYVKQLFRVKNAVVNAYLEQQNTSSQNELL